MKDKILIDRIRISGFRGFEDFEMTFSDTTILTGMNNVGKTTVLKALQLVFGNSNFLTREDFNISNNHQSDRIIIDTRIIAVDENGARENNFNDDWESEFTTDNIIYDNEGNACIPIRTEITYNPLKSIFDKKRSILTQWDAEANKSWKELISKEKRINTNNISFFI